MTTEYKKALDDAIDSLPYGKDTDEWLSGSWTNDHYETIRRALMIADAVENYPVSSGGTWNDAVAHTIEHLKKIGGGE